jgi:transcription initiation factor TFIID subunit TAF12
MTTPTVERKSRVSAETVLKTLTALFGLMVAILGFWTTQLTKEKQQAESRTVVVQQESTELRQQVEDMSQEIERLKQERDAASSTPPGTTPTGGQQYSVVLQLEETLDLDNRRKSKVESSGTEVSRASYSSYLVNPRGSEFFPISTDLTEANCKRAVDSQEDQTDSFHFDVLTQGLTFCVATSESRLAGITVAELPPVSEGPIELAIVLW